jgi:hypothetical protein
MALPEVLEVTEFLRNAGGAQLRVSFFKPRSFAWTTGIPTMGPIMAQPECLLEELERRRISHVIVGRVGPGAAGGQLKQLAESRPDRFHLVFRNRTFAIYRVTAAAPGSPAEPECSPR